MQKILISLLAISVLTACGNDHHEKMHAVDAVKLAEQNALANAPVAEPIKFDDEGMPKMGSTATTDTATATETVTTTDAATAENTDAQTATAEVTTETVTETSTETVATSQ